MIRKFIVGVTAMMVLGKLLVGVVTLVAVAVGEYDFNSTEECPPDLTYYNNTCYTYDDTCPYNLPLPSDQYKDIAEFLNKPHLLQVYRNPNLEYFQWYEPLGRFGELFADEIRIVDALGDYIVTDNGSFFSTNKTENQICAYESFSNEPNVTYCTRYDQICTNNTHRDTTNCHCRNVTQNYLCEMRCDNTSVFNETICSQCEDILEEYDQPIVSLALNYKTNSIYVSAYSFLKLVPLNVAKRMVVYCFTDANSSSYYDIAYRYESMEFRVYNSSFYDQHYTIIPLDGLIGHYWCRGFAFADDEPVDDNSVIIAQGNQTKESFTLNVTVNENTRTYPLTIHQKTRSEISDIVMENLSIIENIMFLRIYERNTTTNTTVIAYRLYFDQINDFNFTMMDVLKNISDSFVHTEYNVSATPSYCLPDITIQDGITLTWEKTPLGSRTIPNELCLQSNSIPVTRKCEGEYLYGTYWTAVSGECTNNNGSFHTAALHQLFISSNTTNDKLINLEQILLDLKDPILVDVHFVSLILQNITLSLTSDPIDNFTMLVQIASHIMDLDRMVLKDAQQLLNTTDMILYNLDQILETYNYTEDENTVMTTKNIYVMVGNLHNGSDVTVGAAFYESGAEVRVVPLTANKTLHLDTQKLKLGVYITGTQLGQVFKLNYTKEPKLVVVGYRNDALFNAGTTSKSTGFLVGIHVSGFEEPFLYDYVRVLIKPDRKYRALLSCNQWVYGRNPQWYNTLGSWYRKALTESEDLKSCKYWTLQHFGILVGVEDDVVLSIIAAVGCAMSMMGNAGVVITGTIHHNWREQSGTKILLNFVLTNFIQNILLAISSGVDSYTHPEICVFIGASLHYSVLSQFTWMVIIGYMQYLRYVEVFYTVQTRFVLISSITAWIIPILPVVALLLWNPDFYVNDDFCYLQDYPLLYTVLLPATIILTTNLTIMSIILYHIYCKSSALITHRDNMSWLNLRLVILLFFLLGLYWVFGIAARFSQLVAFDYFFCISAGIQGFVIFLYFIVFNRMTRNFWMKQLRRSEMITAMQIWLQQRRKMGRVKLDRSKIRRVKVGTLEALRMGKKKEDVKLI